MIFVTKGTLEMIKLGELLDLHIEEMKGIKNRNLKRVKVNKDQKLG